MRIKPRKAPELKRYAVTNREPPVTHTENNIQILATVCLVAVAVLGFSPLTAPAQDAKAEDIEAARSEMLKRWGVDGLVKPSDAEGTAKTLLGRPLVEQPEDQLRELAKRANAAANFAGFILEEYESYYRENYQYDFMKEKVADRGDEMTAFFFFRDTYRLSTFTEDEGDHKGMRFQAEIEMKKRLGLEGMGTFMYWR